MNLVCVELEDLVLQLFLDLMFLDHALKAAADGVDGGGSGGRDYTAGRQRPLGRGGGGGRQSRDEVPASESGLSRPDLRPAYLGLAAAMSRAVSGQKKPKGGRSPAARAVSGAADAKQVVSSLQGLLGETLSRISERSSINVKCFEF